jgi:hypothetical protein
MDAKETSAETPEVRVSGPHEEAATSVFLAVAKHGILAVLDVPCCSLGSFGRPALSWEGTQRGTRENRFAAAGFVDLMKGITSTVLNAI